MHAEIVRAIDAHVAEVQRLRRQLTEPRAIEPGERLDVAIKIAAGAERLARTLHGHCLAAAALSEARA